MNPKRKISGEEGASVVVISISHAEQLQRGTMGGVGLRLQARRKLAQQMGPQYRTAPPARKRELLEAFTQVTGYHRKYAIRLLNQTEETSTSARQARPRRYGTDVQEALIQVWKKANRICTKRLIPFLPTLVDALERHGHLHLSEECREHLLSISVATADRLLRQARGRGPHGIATTRAGTLLKQQIPIRTFQQWDQTQPGFLEVDAVAHCGTNLQGDYLCTLTLTDIATGWTECLPLLYKSQESVLEAVQQARTRFPFPILGLDTDNGSEFINDVLLSYCEQEQITFTRGREQLKNDQCFVEQKNGHIVRQVVGYDRFVGVQAYQQLDELYRALRLYTNGFQPSLKLQGKHYDGRKVRLIYDRAKTPLQRLLLFQGLPASKEHAWKELFRELDPVRLFEQVKDLQQALFIHATSAPPMAKETAEVPVQRFSLEGCMSGSGVAARFASEMGLPPQHTDDDLPSTSTLLEWHRTRHDPFKEVWELIASWVLAHPERTSGEILRELQHLFPERDHLSHLRTLQRGLRKIRARLRTTVVVKWQQEDAIHADVPELTSPQQPEQEASTRDDPGAAIAPFPRQNPSQHQQQPTPDSGVVQEEIMPSTSTTTSTEEPRVPASPQESSEKCLSSPSAKSHPKPGRRRSSLTIEQAVLAYLEEQRKGKRRSKTLEWHQTALRLFEQYLRNECQCIGIDQITETHVRGWLASLCETPTVRGMRRSAGTRESYARSARAFCHWLVRRRYVKQTPFAHLIIPKGKPPPLHLLEPEEWERLLLACRPTGGKRLLVEQAAARNQAILWVLAETGIRTAEVCGLRISDVDREQGTLRVRGKGSRQRWVVLKQEGLHALLAYLDHYRLETVQSKKSRRVGAELLFVSETGHPLRENGIELLFGRLRKRAGITKKEVGPALLRDSFAVRYLQAGGDLFTLRELLGQEESARVKRFVGMRK